MATEYFISQLNQTVQLGVSGDAVDALNATGAGSSVYRDVDVTIAGNLGEFNDIFYVYSDSSYNVNGGGVDSAEDISYVAQVDYLLTALNTVLETNNANASSIEKFTVSTATQNVYTDETGPNYPDPAAAPVDGSGSDQNADSVARGIQVPEDYLVNLAYRLTNLPGAGDVISNKDTVLEDVNDKFIGAFVDAMGTGLNSSDNGVSSSYKVTVDVSDNLANAGSIVLSANASGEVFDSFIARELLAQWLAQEDTNSNQHTLTSTPVGERNKISGFFQANDTLSFLIQLNMPSGQLNLVGATQAANRRETRVYKINILLS